MHGIFHAIDSNHLNAKDAGAAVAGWNRLNLSLNTLNFFIRESVQIAEDETLEPLEDAATAKLVLGHMIQTGIKRNTKYFSANAYQEFLKRAQHAKPIEFKSLKDEPMPEVLADEQPSSNNDEEIPEIKQVVVVSTPIESIVDVVKEHITKNTITPDAPSTGGGRGRKFNPNSAQNVAKRMYAEAVDKSRDAIVKLFMETLNLPQGTATTYYYNARKG